MTPISAMSLSCSGLHWLACYAQVLALLAMEKPVSMSADDIRDEKTKLLRCVKVVEPEDCVLGQYVGNDSMKGYKEDEGVPDDSKTPTFAVIQLHIQNDRCRKDCHHAQ